ncbi:MAG: efflux RND transporter periplasmic adaptor subunit [Dehalococcoidales bacterium]|nr:efflux RND transporter periplasmic adaptor subunit [Dehalococcoidales bacterium]
MKSWQIIAVLLLCLVLAGATACNPFADKEPEVSRQLFKVVRGDLTVSVSGSGNIVVSNEVRLTFGVSGRIDKIYVEEGDNVTKGDVLAKLDTSALELALTQAQVAEEQAKADWEEAKYNLHRLKVLYQPLKVAELRLEVAKSKYEAAKQAVALAQKQLDEATITAPFDGVVASVGADEGDTVSTTTTIIHLIDLTTMELKVDVDELDIPRVKPGQRAIIEVDALPALPLEGEVIFVSPLAKEEAGLVLYVVKIGFDVPQGSGLRVGMSATADIVIDERSNVLLVPNRVIKQDSQGNPIVEVMVNEQIQERPVVIGISDGYQTEIVDGLKEGEVVVWVKPKPSRPGLF